jgi:hypothetical protein
MEAGLHDRAQVERAPKELAGLRMFHCRVELKDRALGAPAAIVRGFRAQIDVA